MTTGTGPTPEGDALCSDASDSRQNDLDTLRGILLRRDVPNMDQPLDLEMATLLDDAQVCRRKLLQPLVQAGMRAFREDRLAEAFTIFGRILARDYDSPPIHELVDMVFRNFPEEAAGGDRLPPPFDDPDIMPQELRVLCGIKALRQGWEKAGLACLQNVHWDVICLGDTAAWVMDLAGATTDSALQRAVAEGFSQNPNMLRQSNFQTQVSLGAAAFRAGWLETARAQFLRFAGLHKIPDASNLIRLVNGLIRTGSEKTAAALVQHLEDRARAELPTDIFARLSLVEAFLALRSPENARRVLRSVDTAQTRDDALVIRMANDSLQAGCLEEGLALVDRAYQSQGITPQTVSLLYLKARLDGRLQDSLDLIEEASRVQTHAPYLTYWRLVLEVQLGRMAAAWEKIMTLEAAGQTVSGLLFLFKGTVLLARGEKRAAVTALKRMLSHFSPPVIDIDWIWQVHFEIALILLGMGEKAEARDMLAIGVRDYQLCDNACPELLRLMDAREADRIPGPTLAERYELRADRIIGEWIFPKPWLYMKAAQLHQLRGDARQARRLVTEKLLPCPYFTAESRRTLQQALLSSETLRFDTAAQALAEAFYPHWPEDSGWRPLLADDILRDCRLGGGRP